MTTDKFLEGLADFIQLTTRCVAANVTGKALAQQGAECLHRSSQTAIGGAKLAVAEINKGGLGLIRFDVKALLFVRQPTYPEFGRCCLWQRFTAVEDLQREEEKEFCSLGRLQLE